MLSGSDMKKTVFARRVQLRLRVPGRVLHAKVVLEEDQSADGLRCAIATCDQGLHFALLLLRFRASFYGL